MVQQEFMDVVNLFKEQGRIFSVHVGHVIKGKISEGDYVQMGDSNPLEILLIFMAEKNLRLVDLFKTLDKDQSMSLTREEFIQGLAVSSTSAIKHNVIVPFSYYVLYKKYSIQ